MRATKRGHVQKSTDAFDREMYLREKTYQALHRNPLRHLRIKVGLTFTGIGKTLAPSAFIVKRYITIS